MDTTKAFARRRKLSAIIWITLAICAGASAVQTVFGFSALSAAITLALGALAWSERRACGMFKANDPRGGVVAFWNQLILGIAGGAYLFWNAATVGDLKVQLAAWDVQNDIIAMVIPLVRTGYLAAGALILISQIALALYDLRVTKLVRTGLPKAAE